MSCIDASCIVIINKNNYKYEKDVILLTAKSYSRHMEALLRPQALADKTTHYINSLHEVSIAA